MEEKQRITRHYSSLEMTRKRELGHTFREDTLISKYYKYMTIQPPAWCKDNHGTADHGSVFNIEFSPNGKIMVVACAKKTILVFDPLSKKLLTKIPDAHDDCVNSFCFLDERTFASASDDCNIALWDSRMLHKKIVKLKGHGSWVKSLSYHHGTQQLVSSAYDDTVRVWDINRYSHNQPKSKVIFTVEHLTRLKLSPGGDKLIISTFDGFITVFHDLDLEHFQDDVNKQSLTNHLSSGQNSENFVPVDRNVPESIVEFPNHSPWSVSALQIHPHGWCLMSRYSTTQQWIEFTTIHDIQTIPHVLPEQVQGQERSKNVKRLSHYIEECNAAQGFIKEQDFSKDGRIIASPFGHGARLLAFGSDCCELCKCDLEDSSKTKQLHEIKCLFSHHHPVCISKFSPTHMLVVTGCLGGEIAFHEPKLS